MSYFPTFTPQQMIALDALVQEKAIAYIKSGLTIQCTKTDGDDTVDVQVAISLGGEELASDSFSFPSVGSYTY